jgi:AraC-like DNA-binding protein
MRRRQSDALDFVDFSRCPNLDGLEVMRARWVKHSFRPHAHDFYTVSLNYSGGGAFDCRGTLRDAMPGTCNLMAPGDLHTGRATCEVGWIYRNLHIDPALLSTLLHGLEYRGPAPVGFKAPIARDPSLAGRLTQVFACLEDGSSLLQNESLLLSVVERLVTDHIAPAHSSGEVGWEHGAVTRVRDWLDAHFEENVSIHALADLVGLSPWYLVRVFRKRLGVPPHRYQTIVRVNRARVLLLAGARISEAAYSAGFCDQSHLNRCFKSVLGIAPGKYLAGSVS